ncbi:MAG: hypothetical protein WA642_21520 [Steroidobacteraceae bacterium]
MIMSSNRKSAGRTRVRLSLLTGPTLLFALAVAMPWDAALADNFAKAYYDAPKDQLVVTISYRGTNPDHIFSLKWGQCKEPPDGSEREIVAEILDDQWQDVASRNFKKTTRFGLEKLRCRPAKLTLRTAPRFYYTLQIPAQTVPAP